MGITTSLGMYNTTIVTTTSPLNWGLLSTANINRAVITPIRRSRRSRLLAVASRSQESADTYALTWNIPRAYPSYEALLVDPEIDVIYNSLPNSMHAEWSIRAVEAGKHVLCEKPLTLSLTEVDAMHAASLRTGKTITEAFMFRHHPQTILVKSLVDSGEIGQIQLIRGVFTIQYTRQENYRFDPIMGGGCLWDVGCYPISYARFILGNEPDEVFGWQQLGSTGIDLQFLGQMRFPGEVYAHFHSSYITPYVAFIEIIGSLGTIKIPAPFITNTRGKILVIKDDSTQVIRSASQAAYLGEIMDIEDAAILGKPPRLSLIESRNNIGTILALLESARTGKPAYPASL